MKEKPVKYQSGAWGVIWAVVHSRVSKNTLQEMFTYLHKKNPDLNGKPSLSAMSSALHQRKGNRIRNIYANPVGMRKNREMTWRRIEGKKMPPVIDKPEPITSSESSSSESSTPKVEEIIDQFLGLLRPALIKLLKPQ